MECLDKQGKTSKMKIKPVVFIVPAVILVVSLLIGSSLLFRVFISLTVIGLLAFLWAWLGLWGLKTRHEDIPVSCQATDNISDRITIINDNILPKIALKVEEKNNLPGYTNLATLSVSSHKERSWEHIISCRRRGRYTLGPAAVTSADPFGLFSRCKDIGEDRKSVV
jgi:uncharacterized protein (DUF58 family)